MARAREKYARDPASFATDFTRQDAATLNTLRACGAVLHMGQRIVRREGLADAPKRMVAFRNIASHGTHLA